METLYSDGHAVYQKNYEGFEKMCLQKNEAYVDDKLVAVCISCCHYQFPILKERMKLYCCRVEERGGYGYFVQNIVMINTLDVQHL